MTEAPDTLLGEIALSSMCHIASQCPSGCFVEFGVYKGGSAWRLARVASEQGRELHLYDTFEGIPFRAEVDSHQVGDFADTSYEAVCEAIPDAKVHRGVFPETLVKMPPIAFVHVDADQYQSIKAALDVLGPLMVPGGAMIFDDVPCLPGATLALQEWLQERRMAYEMTAANKALVRF
jgi:O-methyltransferase